MSAVLDDPRPGFRPMRFEDLDAVMAIEGRAYDYPWTVGIFRDCLRVGYCCWVAEQREAIGGYGVMMVAASEAHLLNLCVAPERQGEGLGYAMLSHLVDVARGHHAERVLLEVRPSNETALWLYLGYGFSEVGRRRRYYPAPEGREDALVLALTL